MDIEEFISLYGDDWDSFNEDDYVEHLGTPQMFDGDPNGSGRYRQGSGKNPYQRALDFQGMVKQLRESGNFKNDTEIARALGMTSTQFRNMTTRSKAEQMEYEQHRVRYLRDERGMSWTAIAKQMGYSTESQARNRYKQMDSNTSKTKLNDLTDILKQQTDEKKYLDIGSGVEVQLGTTDTRLKAAAAALESEGYRVVTIAIPQVSNPSQKTNMRVLVKADKNADIHDLRKDIYEHRNEVQSISGIYKEDNGRTVRNVVPPVAIKKNRVKVRYAEDGGKEKDGVIELKPGVEDISLKNAHYAQVRIDVEGTHYLKGMAVYGDPKEFPPGCDIIFNTNKHKGTPMLGPDKDHTVLKPLKKTKEGDVDLTNPFGATIKNDEDLIRAQQFYIGKDGKKHQSALNIVNEEGDWGKWKKTIASQMLSKQPIKTAQKQLKLASDKDRLELDEIESLTNPIVKKKLLEEYADGVDTKAVDLKGAAFPRQAAQVIIPLPSLKPDQIYAPRYVDGEEVVLVRYPHAGRFEMPKLKVNNKNTEGKRVITPNAKDAVGINSKVAEQLSGADFDGDTVLVIPTKGQNIRVDKARKSLTDFDPSEAYPAYKGMTRVGKGDGFVKQTQMGVVSNLITDMTIKGANVDEIERAVKHSMVIIDAEKHNLNWKQSEKDNRIDELKRKYQKKPNGTYGGASTLISKASGTKYIPERGAYAKIDPKTGKRIFTETGKAYDTGNKDAKGYSKVIYERDGKYYIRTKATDKDISEGRSYHETEYKPLGKVKRAQTTTTPMAYTDDARTLSSGYEIENVYADYANTLKSYANEARKASLAIRAPKRDPEARVKYANEVASLNNQLSRAKSYAPLERQATLIASKRVEMERKANPERYDKASPDGTEELKKLRTQCMNSARRAVGADDKAKIQITPGEWEAIQNNAISKSMLEDILNYTDSDQIKKLAMPRESKELNAAKIRRIKSLANNNYTTSEIADDLGVSVTTVEKYI